MSGSNYDDVISQLTGFGLILTDGLQIGTTRPVRCRVRDGGRERRGWYWLHEIPAREGGTLIVGSYGIWQGNDNGATKVDLPKQRRERIAQAQAEALQAFHRQSTQHFFAAPGEARPDPATQAQALRQLARALAKAEAQA